MKNIFVKEEIHAHLEQFGYYTLPLLIKEEVNKLLYLFNDTNTGKTQENKQFYLSVRECTTDKSIEISAFIKEIITPKIESLASDFTLYGGAFIKKAGNNLKNEFPLHQDFTLTKPPHSMYAIWIALQDTTIENGAMFVAPKSHKLFNNLLSSNYNNTTILRKDISEIFIKPIELKAGEAIIFSDKLFHGSYCNSTNNDRIAVTARITSKGAPFVFYQKKDEKRASVYRISPLDLIQYFNDFHQGKIPEHSILEAEIPYQHIVVNSNLLEQELRKVNNMPPLSFIEKVKRKIFS